FMGASRPESFFGDFTSLQAGEINAAPGVVPPVASTDGVNFDRAPQPEERDALLAPALAGLHEVRLKADTTYARMRDTGSSVDRGGGRTASTRRRRGAARWLPRRRRRRSA